MVQEKPWETSVLSVIKSHTWGQRDTEGLQHGEGAILKKKLSYVYWGLSVHVCANETDGCKLPHVNVGNSPPEESSTCS